MTTTLYLANGKYVIETYTSEKTGKPCAKMVTEKGKVKWSYSFRNEEIRDNYVIQIATRIERDEEERAEILAANKVRVAEKLSFLAVGSIFYTCWGYDQTNVDFYKVMKISGKRITVRRLANDTTETGFMSGNTAPGSDFHPFDKKEYIVGITKCSNFQIDGHHAGIWDGKEIGCSWYA